MTRDAFITLLYLVSTGLFIFSLKWMSHPLTARRGIFSGVAAMVLAIGGALLTPGIVSYHWIVAAIALGCIVGVPLSWVPLTAVPQRTALSHALAVWRRGWWPSPSTTCTISNETTTYWSIPPTSYHILTPAR